MTLELNFGDYIVAKETYTDTESTLHWDKNEIALIFSRRGRKSQATGMAQHYDLLFENGRTAFTVAPDLIRRYFRLVHRDPDVVIDGCSTNPGWEQARQNRNGE